MAPNADKINGIAYRSPVSINLLRSEHIEVLPSTDNFVGAYYPPFIYLNTN